MKCGGIGKLRIFLENDSYTPHVEILCPQNGHIGHI